MAPLRRDLPHVVRGGGDARIADPRRCGVGIFGRLGTHVPHWIYRFANGNVLFAGIPTFIAAVLRVGLRYLTRQAAGDARAGWTDLDFGL